MGIHLDIINIMPSPAAGTGIMDDIGIELIFLTGVRESDDLIDFYLILQLKEVVVPVLEPFKMQLSYRKTYD